MKDEQLGGERGANGGVHVSYFPLSSHHNTFVYTTTTHMSGVTCNFFPKVQSKLTKNKSLSISLLFLTLWCALLSHGKCHVRVTSSNVFWVVVFGINTFLTWWQYITLIALLGPQWTSIHQRTHAHTLSRMDGKWLGDSFLLSSSSRANHDGYLSCFVFWTYLLT